MISLENGTALALAVAVIGAAVGYGKLQGLIESLSARVKLAEDWKDVHEKDATTQRAAYEVRLTAFDVRLGRGEEKFEQISRDITDIKVDLRTLLTRRRGDRGRESQ